MLSSSLLAGHNTLGDVIEQHSEYTESTHTCSPSPLSSASKQQPHDHITVSKHLLYTLTSAVVALSILCIVLALPHVQPYSSVSPHSSAASSSSWNWMMKSSAEIPIPTYQGTNAPNSLVFTMPSYANNTLPGQIKSHTILALMTQVYQIAMDNGGNRAIQNPGFNMTCNFIEETLRNRTNLVNIERSYFSYNLGDIVSAASFSYVIGSGESQQLSLNSDYRYFANSMGLQSKEMIEAIFVANGGCYPVDWTSALGPAPPTKYWAVIEANSSCTDNVRIGTAQMFGALGIVISNTMNVTTRRLVAPDSTKLAVISMDPRVAQVLIYAIKLGGTSAVTISATASIVKNALPIANICADTPYGDPTSVVLVGGHSDGVAAGPGTNDDGSGTVATLTLAIAMSRLMTQTNYRPVNMVKFCWFGGEEAGLLGSAEVVRVGVQRDVDPTARVGSRAKDWAVMIDLDMLGSMNFQHLVYDANVYIPPNTPVRARKGSQILSSLMLEYFHSNGLPGDSDLFDGRSDYGPFLVAGIPAGGVNAGADNYKSEDDRIRYLALTGWGGVAGQIHDQCYHKACDGIDNIMWAALANQTQCAAYAIEILANQQNLRKYLGLDQISTAASSQTHWNHLPFEYRFQAIPATDEEPMEFNF